MVFNAYERTNPTNAASTPVVIRATRDKFETKKMIHVPTNSNLTANQRFIETLGREQVWFASTFFLWFVRKISSWPNARIVEIPAMDSENQAKIGDLETASSRFSSREVSR